MPELKLTLETVTPLFLGGAEARGTPELRPPAFRGAMRYWLRAALGGVIGDNNLPELHRLESAVFGAADEKVGASAVSILVPSKRLPSPQRFGRQSRRQPTGRDYLYWSMDESGKVEKGNYQPPKQFYPPNMEFEVVLRTRVGVKNADEKLQQAIAALWLLVQMGGIGSRARRTGGSLCAHGETEAGLVFDLNAKTVKEAALQLGKGLATIRKQFSVRDQINPHIPSKFDVLHPSASRIWILGMWDTSEDAVEAIGSSMRTFRERREPDHRNVAKWLNGEKIATVERAAFGLPLVYRYSDGGLSGTVQGRTQQPSIERRASPLWLKVSKTTQGKYIGIATLFNSEFLPQEEMLHVKRKEPPPPIAPPKNYDLIVQWIEMQFGERSEVPYD